MTSGAKVRRKTSLELEKFRICKNNFLKKMDGQAIAKRFVEESFKLIVSLKENSSLKIDFWQKYPEIESKFEHNFSKKSTFLSSEYEIVNNKFEKSSRTFAKDLMELDKRIIDDGGYENSRIDKMNLMVEKVLAKSLLPDELKHGMKVRMRSNYHENATSGELTSKALMSLSENIVELSRDKEISEFFEIYENSFGIFVDYLKTVPAFEGFINDSNQIQIITGCTSLEKESHETYIDDDNNQDDWFLYNKFLLSITETKNNEMFRLILNDIEQFKLEKSNFFHNLSNYKNDDFENFDNYFFEFKQLVEDFENSQNYQDTKQVMIELSSKLSKIEFKLFCRLIFGEIIETIIKDNLEKEQDAVKNQNHPAESINSPEHDTLSRSSLSSTLQNSDYYFYINFYKSDVFTFFRNQTSGLYYKDSCNKIIKRIVNEKITKEQCLFINYIGKNTDIIESGCSLAQDGDHFFKLGFMNNIRLESFIALQIMQAFHGKNISKDQIKKTAMIYPEYFGIREMNGLIFAMKVAGFEKVSLISQVTALAAAFFRKNFIFKQDFLFNRNIIIFNGSAEDYETAFVQLRSDNYNGHSIEIIKYAAMNFNNFDAKLKNALEKEKYDDVILLEGEDKTPFEKILHPRKMKLHFYDREDIMKGAHLVIKNNIKVIRLYEKNIKIYTEDKFYGKYCINQDQTKNKRLDLRTPIELNIFDNQKLVTRLKFNHKEKPLRFELSLHCSKDNDGFYRVYEQQYLRDTYPYIVVERDDDYCCKKNVDEESAKVQDVLKKNQFFEDDINLI